jgi:D-alanyl-D-alanine carboxypeptidase
MLTRRNLLLGTAAAVAGAAVLPSAPAVAAPARGPFQEAVDRLAAAGCVAALARFDSFDGTSSAAAGREFLDGPREAVAYGRFRAGSLTKTFTATVVLQLVAERRLRLTDTLDRLLPGGTRMPNADRITLRHLLGHTSGVPEYTEVLFADPEEFLPLRHRSWTPAELLALVADGPARFEPGTSWWYTNTNYVLLGLVVERVTARPYAHEVYRRILRPLGMHGTELPGTRETITGRHAHGYATYHGETLDVTELNPSVAWSAGEIVSTTADLNRFYGALNAGRILRPDLLREMRTATEVTPGYGYGLGLLRWDLPDGRALWGHDGGIPGYATLALSTEDGRQRLAVSMTPYGAGDAYPALQALVNLAFGAANARNSDPVPQAPTDARRALPLLRSH